MTYDCLMIDDEKLLADSTAEMLLLDINLGDGSGFELCKELRETTEIPIKLTSLEFKLLSCLIQNAGRMVSKQELFEKVWENKFTGDGTLNVHIRKIREAIEKEPGNPEYIITVWGDGYKFVGRDR